MRFGAFTGDGCFLWKIDLNRNARKIVISLIQTLQLVGFDRLNIYENYVYLKSTKLNIHHVTSFKIIFFPVVWFLFIFFNWVLFCGEVGKDREGCEDEGTGR